MHCRLGSIGCGGCFAALLRCLLLLADGGSLADALPSYFGGCFATVIVLLGGCFATYGYFELGGCFAAIPLGFAAMVVLFGGCFATISYFVLASVFCAGPAPRVAFVWVACLECPPPPCFFCCLWPFVSLSVFFLQCFFFVSPLCSCVVQVLFGRNKVVSVTAFFLMKNVLRHGREKNVWTVKNNFGLRSSFDKVTSV